MKFNKNKYENKAQQLKKISEILENKKQLESFDSDIFENVVDRIIIGEQ